MTVQELATEALEYYRQSTAEEREGIYVHTDNAPEWVVDMTRNAHGDMMPDDWKFKFVVEALEAISEADEGEEEDELYEWEPDVYNHVLLQWVSSNLGRMGYVDEAVDNYGWTDLARALMAGQKTEFEWVAASVLKSLRDRLEELEAEEDEDE